MTRLIEAWIREAYERRTAVAAPDLCERYRRVWAIPNAAIRTVSPVRRPDGLRRPETDAAWRDQYAVGLYGLFE